MAASALQTTCLAVNHVAVNRGSNVFVTATAGVLGDFVIEPGDLDRVGIAAGGEVEGMPESVVGLHRIFADDVMRSVAVVAGRDRMMTRLHPRVVLCLHDVAVGAGHG